MNRFYTYITLGFVLFTLNLKAQIYDTTSYYIATNYSFKKILTDFIEDEKTYIHYDSSCIFTIHIQDYKNSVLIILISNGCTQERDNVVNTLEFRKEIIEKILLNESTTFSFLSVDSIEANSLLITPLIESSPTNTIKLSGIEMMPIKISAEVDTPR